MDVNDIKKITKEIPASKDNIKACEIVFPKGSDIIIVEDSDPPSPNFPFQPRVFSDFVEDNLNSITITFKCYDDLNKLEIKSGTVDLGEDTETVWMNRKELVTDDIEEFVIGEMSYDSIEETISRSSESDDEDIDKSIINRLVGKLP